jgi:hypothetical protein
MYGVHRSVYGNLMVLDLLLFCSELVYSLLPLICLCVLSQNESLQLELSDSATPDNSTRRRPTSPDDSTRRRATSPDDSTRRICATSPDESTRRRATTPDDSTRRRATSPDDSARRHHVEPTQSSQLSAILAPNSLLYSGDLDNIIDNDEDVQVYSVAGYRRLL